MARFPYKPGAGAKAIRNPIYWNRLYLQESQGNGRGSRVGQYSEDAHLTARWLNINTNLNFFLCGWFKPVLEISDRLTNSELRAVNNALEVINEFRDTMGSSWDYMSQGNLNKFVTRIKRLILIVFRLTIKYGLFSKGEERLVSYAYDSDEKDFVLLYDSGRFDRIYFMGRPAVSQIAKIRQLYTQSVDAVAKEFGAKKSKKKKKVQKKTTKPKKGRKDSSSRPEAVVEKIDAAGVVRFNYDDCVHKRADVRSRLKLHLRIAFQPYKTNSEKPDLRQLAEGIIELGLNLEEGASVRIPVEYRGSILKEFEFVR